ncbi:Ku protein [Streptomyces sp. NPDC020096]
MVVISSKEVGAVAVVWGGVLSFGLVTLPVQALTAIESHTMRFHQLQRGTGDRVRNKRVNERTGEEVPLSEIVKGYDTGVDYVVVEPDELDDIAPGRSKSLTVTGFVDLDQVNPIYFDSTYYLAPRGEEYARVYVLLREAMAQSGKAGIATVVMHNKEYLVAVKAKDDVLVMHTMHWADEVRDPYRQIPTLPLPEVPLTTAELEGAVHLVEAMSQNWNPEQYRDDYADRVRELVEAKHSGGTVQAKAEAPPTPTSPEVADLTAALQASMRRAEERAAGDRKPTADARPDDKVAAKRQSGGTAELEQMTKAELYAHATAANIPGRSTMSRDDLIKALSTPRQHRRRAS